METAKTFLYFETVKVVTVKNWKLGLINRIIEILVLLYIIFYAIIVAKGYQAVSPVEGVLYTKVKGIATDQKGIVYDSGDLVTPATESAALFVATRALHTVQRENTQCTDPEKSNACQKDADCFVGNVTSNGAVEPICNVSVGRCLIRGWCPIEDESLPFDLYTGIDKWTIFMRSHISYSSFIINGKVVTANNGDKAGLGYNIFSIASMLPAENWTDIQLNGAIVTVVIDWTCNIDLGLEKCRPKYTFRRVDAEATGSKGFNYRYIDYTDRTRMTTGAGQNSRVYSKVYGVRLLFQTTGRGGMFDFKATIVTIGSAAAFFSVASLVTDFVLAQCHPRKLDYKQKKRESIMLDNPDQDVNLETV